MAEFALPLTADGSVAAPSGSFKFIEPSAESVTYFDTGGMSLLEIPEFGWVSSDGVNPMRLITRDVVYDAGGIAPAAGLTLNVTGGTQASLVGTYTDRPAINDVIFIQPANTDQQIPPITFVDTFAGVTTQVKRGADGNETYANFIALWNGTGTLGVEYSGTDATDFSDYGKVVATQNTGAGTWTLTHDEYGTAGNSGTCAQTVGVDFLSTGANFTGGADGTGTAPAAGTYRYFYTWYNSVTGGETGRSPITSITKEGNWNVATGAITGSADTTFGFINVYRTTKSGVDFFLVDTVLPTASMTDSISDADLVAQNAGISWAPLDHRAYAEGGVPRGRALAMFRGRLWTIGAKIAADYTRGEIGVTNDSAAISFFKAASATALQGPTARMVGRTFIVTGTSEEYTIISVDEANATAVIDRNYEGTTDAHVGYTIKDDYDASRLRASVEFLWNQWPVDESPGRIETDDAEGGTALLATKSRLFAFSRTSIISVTGDGIDSWDINKVSSGVGCVAPSMVVGVEGGGVFLSPDGFYALSPDESVTPLSSPKARKRELAQGIDGTIKRIEWDNVDQGYSFYDETDRVVVFGLPLDGASVPNYEIVFDLQNGTWMLYKRAEWTAMTAVALPDGSKGVIAGDREGNLWHAGIGESDGFYGTEAVQTLTGAQTVRVLTVTGTPYSTSGDGEAGKPVIVLYADGSTVAYGKVASNTTAALTLTEDLATAPAASDQVILGGIAWQWKSGFTTFGEEFRKKTLRSVTIRHAPATRGDYYFSFAVDGGSLQVCPVGTSIGDMTDKDGKIRHKVQWPGDSHQINVRGFKPGGQAVFRGGVFDLVVRENEAG